MREGAAGSVGRAPGGAAGWQHHPDSYHAWPYAASPFLQVRLLHAVPFVVQSSREEGCRQRGNAQDVETHCRQSSRAHQLETALLGLHGRA